MSNLKEAISYIYDVEKNNYFMTRAIFQVAQEIHKPRVKKEIKVDTKGLQEPKEPSTPYVPSKPSTPSFSRAHFKWRSWLRGSAIILFVLTVIIAAIATGFDATKLDEGDNSLIVSFGYIIGYVVCIILKPIFELINGYRRYKKDCKKYKSEMVIYNRRHAQYEEDIKEYESEYAKYKTEYKEYKAEYDRRYNAIKKADEDKYKARQDALNSMLTQLTNKLAQSITLLIDMYDKVGIDSNYRNIVPIGYMHEFLRLGIATKLEGADGLYYLIRKELQVDKMNQKLDDIVAKMDTIIDKQHVLYSELVGLNLKCDNMITASVNQTYAILAQNDAINQQNNLISNQNALMDKIQSDTQIAAYNSDRMAREQEYMNYFQRYDRWKK